MNILCVCVGNICRSPMAEALFHVHTAQLRPHLSITSAGIDTQNGYPAASMAQELIKERGINLISSHKSRQITQALMQPMHLVLVMERWQKDIILDNYPFLRGRVFLLGEWTGEEIDDPYGKSRQNFEEALEKIESSIVSWIPKLELLLPTQIRGSLNSLSV